MYLYSSVHIKHFTMNYSWKDSCCCGGSPSASLLSEGRVNCCAWQMTGTLSVLVGSQTQSFIDYLSGTTCSMNKGIGSADKLIMALRGEEKDRKRHRETATKRLRDRKKKTDTSVYLLLNFFLWSSHAFSAYYESSSHSSSQVMHDLLSLEPFQRGTLTHWL